MQCAVCVKQIENLLGERMENDDKSEVIPG
jgi:hypothetical protein